MLYTNYNQQITIRKLYPAETQENPPAHKGPGHITNIANNLFIVLVT